MSHTQPPLPCDRKCGASAGHRLYAFENVWEARGISFFARSKCSFEAAYRCKCLSPCWCTIGRQYCRNGAQIQQVLWRIQRHPHMSETAFRTRQLRPHPLRRHYMLGIAKLKHVRPKHLYIHPIRPVFSAIAMMLNALIDQPRIKERTISSKTDNNICLTRRCCLLVAPKYVKLRSTPTIIAKSMIGKILGQLCILAGYGKPDMIDEFSRLRCSIDPRQHRDPSDRLQYLARQTCAVQPCLDNRHHYLRHYRTPACWRSDENRTSHRKPWRPRCRWTYS